MSFKLFLPLFVCAIVLFSGCVVPFVDDILPNSGMTATSVDQTLTAYSTPGYWNTLSINKQQYNVGITKQTDGIKYLISPAGYPYGYEGVLTSGASKTIVISSEKLYEMGGFGASIWNTGGIWRVGDTFTLTCSGDSVNVKWEQTGNTDPKITSFTATPGTTISTNDSLEINADWNGGGDSDLIFHEWYLDGKIASGWIYVTPETDEKRLRMNGLPEGTHTVKLEVWDSGKNLVSKTQTITVSYSASSPTANINVLGCLTGCSPSTNISYGSSVLLQSYSTSNLQDPNLQNVTHTWYLDGKLLGSQYYIDTLGYQVRIPSDNSMLSIGVHTVKLVVQNSKQYTDETTATFSILNQTTTVTDPTTVACPTCEAGEHCVNGQCVPLPEATPPPAGTFTITVYNNHIGSKNDYVVKNNSQLQGTTCDYQYKSIWGNIALEYKNNSISQWSNTFYVDYQTCYQAYAELIKMPLPTPTLAQWSNQTDWGVDRTSMVDSGAGWNKTAKYKILAFTEQYVTVQIYETVNTFTYCGDGTCQENCATCPADCGVCTEEQKILYNQAPTARFGYTVNGKQVLINDQSRDPDGQIVNKMLSFGDGSTKNDTNALETHEYADYGTYTITLFVTDNYGALSKTDAKISVLPATVYVTPVTTTTSPSTTTTTATTTNTTDDTTTTSTVSGTTGGEDILITTPTVSGISGGSSTVSNPYSSIVPSVNTSEWSDFFEQKVYLPLTIPFIDRDYVKMWEIGCIVLLLGLVLMFRKNFEIKGKGKRRKRK